MNEFFPVDYICTKKDQVREQMIMNIQFRNNLYRLQIDIQKIHNTKFGQKTLIERLLNEMVGGTQITMINGLLAADADIGEATDIVARR